MGQVGNTLENIKRRYTEYLVNNVELVTSVESWIKTLSYLIAGRISKTHSTVIAELMYTSSSLFTLFNDHLLRKSHNLLLQEAAGCRRLKICLSCLEAVEVFIEIAARQYGDPTIRWLLIFCVELAKTVGRFVLQFQYKTGMRHFPLIQRLNRKTLNTDRAEGGSDDPQTSSEPDSYYTLPHSGRKIKSISTRHSLGSTAAAGNVLMTALNREQMIAESLHNLQPIIHLSSAACFGEMSWTPWLASLATDLASLGILKQSQYRYTKGEMSELVRRQFVLWMYLLRSPCYDRCTKTRLLRLLSVFQMIPGVKYIVNAMIAYLPEWQRTYFYTWTS